MELNVELSRKQLELLQSKHEINIVCAGRGAGKTAITAIIAIIHLLQGRNVIIISPIFRQLRDNNFQQVLKFLDIMGLGAYLDRKDLRVKYKGHQIAFVSGEAAKSLRGYTSIATLVFDETADLDREVYKLAYATMRDLNYQKRKIYIVGTPPATEDHWVAAMSKRDDVNVMYATAKDNPFIEADYLPTLEREYEDLPEDFKRRELYGEMVFGTDSLRSMFADFTVAQGAGNFVSEPIVAGLDIGSRGSDMTALIIRRGKQVLKILTTTTADDEALKKFVIGQHALCHFTQLRYDSTGFGHLLTFDIPGCEVHAINFGAAGGERFLNQRAVIYAKLANEKTIYLSPADYKTHGASIQRELKATRYEVDDSRKLKLIKKELIKEKLGGASPDRSDALALAFSSYTPVKHVLPKRPASALHGLPRRGGNGL
jgi:hypothetical protein